MENAQRLEHEGIRQKNKRQQGRGERKERWLLQHKTRNKTGRVSHTVQVYD